MSFSLSIIIKAILFSLPITAGIIILIRLIYRWTDTDIELPGCLAGIVIVFGISFHIVHNVVFKHDTAEKTLVHQLFSPGNIGKSYYRNESIPDSFSKYRGGKDVFLNKTGKTLVIYEVNYTSSEYDISNHKQHVAQIILPEEYFTWPTNLDSDGYYKMFVSPPKTKAIHTSRSNLNKRSFSFTYFLDYFDSEQVKNEIRGMPIERFNKFE
jgi:hypothetical protein